MYKFTATFLQIQSHPVFPIDLETSINMKSVAYKSLLLFCVA